MRGGASRHETSDFIAPNWPRLVTGTNAFDGARITIRTSFAWISHSGLEQPDLGSKIPLGRADDGIAWGAEKVFLPGKEKLATKTTMRPSL
jgi:hypothetical protein